MTSVSVTPSLSHPTGGIVSQSTACPLAESKYWKIRELKAFEAMCPDNSVGSGIVDRCGAMGVKTVSSTRLRVSSLSRTY